MKVICSVAIATPLLLSTHVGRSGPDFYQAPWFAATVAVSALLVLFTLHRIRVRQIVRVMNARLDERLAERTRVARELYDALLQTVHGSKLVADRALKDPTDPDQLVRALEQLSTWLEQAAVEGRAALNSLRVSTAESNDLAAALQRAIDECRMDTGAEIALVVSGRPRTMHPIVRDEIYRIGYEAIRNACVHSRARRIDVALGYGNDILLRITDNGVGIAPDAVEQGKPGPFGLRGMKERAEGIGATFTLISDRGLGTVVTLVIPGRVGT